MNSRWAERFTGLEYQNAVREALHSGDAREWEARAGNRLGEIIGGGAHVTTCSSGTDALELALRSLRIGEGDTVVVPAVGFTACASAVQAVGARPAFADVSSPLDPRISVASVLRIVEETDVAAVMPVHYDGRPCHVARLRAQLPTGVKVVVDGCQALGATRGPRSALLQGHAAAVSFNWTKIAGAWEGGAVVSRRSGVIRDARRLKRWGHHEGDRARQLVLRGGGNAKMSLPDLALLVHDLGALQERLDRGRRNRAVIRARLTVGCDAVVPESEEAPHERWSPYTVRMRLAGSVGTRDAWLAALRERREDLADSGDVPPLHQHEMLRWNPRDPEGLRAAELSWERGMRLRSHRDPLWAMTEDEARAAAGLMGEAAAEAIEYTENRERETTSA